MVLLDLVIDLAYLAHVADHRSLALLLVSAAIIVVLQVQFGRTDRRDGRLSHHLLSRSEHRAALLA